MAEEHMGRPNSVRVSPLEFAELAYQQLEGARCALDGKVFSSLLGTAQQAITSLVREVKRLSASPASAPGLAVEAEVRRLETWKGYDKIVAIWLRREGHQRRWDVYLRKAANCYRGYRHELADAINAALEEAGER